MFTHFQELDSRAKPVPCTRRGKWEGYLSSLSMDTAFFGHSFAQMPQPLQKS